MERTLSVVLPIYNAQYALVSQVRRLLELLPTIAQSFEILIVDDGSSDQSDEVAYELSVQYDAVRVVRHSDRLGAPVAAQTGVRNAKGDIIFVQGENEPIREEDLRRVAESTQPPVDVENIEPKPLDAGLIQRLVNWGAELKRVQQFEGASHAVENDRETVPATNSSPTTSPTTVAADLAPPKFAKNCDEDGFTIPTRRRRSTT